VFVALIIFLAGWWLASTKFTLLPALTVGITNTLKGSNTIVVHTKSPWTIPIFTTTSQSLTNSLFTLESPGAFAIILATDRSAFSTLQAKMVDWARIFL